MPREGIFAEVIDDGRIKVGDSVVVEPKNGFSVGIITLSDRASQGVYEDKTSPAIDEYIRGKFNISYIRKELLPDEVKRLEMVLTDFADTQQFDLIITNGSTGVSPRDIAPEGILSVITKRLNGFEEIMRFESYKKTPHAIISRAVCGIRKNSLILSVPGSPKAAVENLEAVIRAVAHAIAKIQGDTSTCG
jgi:molybdenum cofactor synthesis domain-containing protein